ncbi:MAG: cobaltochelatase subunit CobN [Pseudomonadota bacterium]|nr:cobaltochelatase subunit CobN [Pseudomonadota bacterium]
MKGALRRVLLAMALCLVLLGRGAAAAPVHVFAVVSERAAPALAAGAASLAAQAPQVRVQARTPAQLRDLSPAALQAALAQADAVIIAGIYGEPAAPLAGALQASVPADGRRSVWPIRSDGALLSLAAAPAGRPGWSSAVPAQAADLARALNAGDDPAIAALHERQPALSPWITANRYWQGRDAANMAGLLALVAQHAGAALRVPAPVAVPALRFETPAAGTGPVVALLDLEASPHAALHAALCEALAARELTCLPISARWGPATTQALERLERRYGERLAGIISLQSFVLGGSQSRGRAEAALAALDVPVMSGIVLGEQSVAEWQLDVAGLPAASVYHRLAMPEVQGLSQPLVLAGAGATREDARTGLSWREIEPIGPQLALAAGRLARWQRLARLPNADKRVAIVYYNHPPGRHNIGADNLDVPASLWTLLHALRRAGYTTGPLPPDPAALLAALQTRGVNLPEDHAALRELARQVPRLPTTAYADWFATLPGPVRAEMRGGPLARLQAQFAAALQAEPVLTGPTREALGRRLTMVETELRHVLEGSAHPAREPALAGLTTLMDGYRALLRPPAAGVGTAPALAELDTRVQALTALGIEGLRGWGSPPGRSMVVGDSLVLPGLTFGNVFIGPQPPRGWELDEELLHANLIFPPPHQYLAFYRYLQHDFAADAVIHLGRHSTYEFLPHKRAGLDATDYPMLIAGELPGIYPYIVDGVGEGLQAKRRGLAVIVDHLTPPIAASELYGELLGLRQLVESFEAAPVGAAARGQAVASLRERLRTLELEDELALVMADELERRGQSLASASDELLVHEVGHYLTLLQEQFMPLGLHVFGRPWSDEAVATLLDSMAPPAAARAQQRAQLIASPPAEIAAVLAALSGRFVRPGKGNDPLRAPDVLPTGRNFHALDPSLLPTRIGWALGRRLAETARAESAADPAASEALVLWASDTVRDEGAMVAFALALMGIEPRWSERGQLAGLTRTAQAERRDVLITTSGLFRDLYGELLHWLDHAGRLALAGSAQVLAAEPALRPALAAALAPLPAPVPRGAEPLARNHLARRWRERVLARLDTGMAPARAGREAAWRIFGDAPGGYGAGVNRLAERSGAWSERGELASAYRRRMGHVYGLDADGLAAPAAFGEALAGVGRTYLGRASHLYGLLDNNDAFDYLGGLSMAVEQVRGTVPASHVIDHADPAQARLRPLPAALLGELRAQFLNPAWIEPLMAHGYAGARTMGSEFIEYLWGWQVTNPDIIRSAVWDEVAAVYLDDSLDLGLAAFLAQEANVHVQTHIMAVFLVAAERGFWQPSPARLEALSHQFAEQVTAHGLPGSGHAAPDHPMLESLSARLPAPLREAFLARLAAARGEDAAGPVRARVRALDEPAPAAPSARPAPAATPEPVGAAAPDAVPGEAAPPTAGEAASSGWQVALALLALALLAAGVRRGVRAR